MQVSSKVKDAFVEEIMEVVELTPIRNSLVGLPGEPAAPRRQPGSLPSIGSGCQPALLPSRCWTTRGSLLS